jgi:uncharacterized protein
MAKVLALVPVLTGLLITPALANPAPANAPSFDCAKAVTATDKAVCADADLAARDRTVAQLFALVRKDAMGVGPSGELAAQRAWLVERDKECAKAPSLTPCLKTEYEARLQDLAVAALIRAPDAALAELRRQNPARAFVYEAIWKMATLPAGAARTSQVAALIGPEFTKVAADQQAMLDPIKTPQQAAGSVKTFASFIDLTGAVEDTALTMPCEAIVKQPGLIDALDSMFGSSMDNSLGGSDCADMLPPPTHFEALAQDALQTSMANSDCTGTIRYAGMRSYAAFLIAVQLYRQGAQAKPDADVVKQAAAYERKHTAAVALAVLELAAYYTRELHAPNPVAAKTAVDEVVQSAYAVCAF